MIVIILINKSEYKKVHERFPDLHIRRTVSQKSKRGRYYMTERQDAMVFLMDLRGEHDLFVEDQENISDHLI